MSSPEKLAAIFWGTILIGITLAILNDLFKKPR